MTFQDQGENDSQESLMVTLICSLSWRDLTSVCKKRTPDWKPGVRCARVLTLEAQQNISHVAVCNHMVQSPYPALLGSQDFFMTPPKGTVLPLNTRRMFLKSWKPSQDQFNLERLRKMWNPQDGLEQWFNHPNTLTLNTVPLVVTPNHKTIFVVTS